MFMMNKMIVIVIVMNMTAGQWHGQLALVSPLLHFLLIIILFSILINILIIILIISLVIILIAILIIILIIIVIIITSCIFFKNYSMFQIYQELQNVKKFDNWRYLRPSDWLVKLLVIKTNARFMDNLEIFRSGDSGL